MNRKAHVACNVNCLIETVGLLKVRGNQGRYTVTHTLIDKNSTDTVRRVVPLRYLSFL